MHNQFKLCIKFNSKWRDFTENVYLCILKQRQTMNRKELDAYVDAHQKINSFCIKVLEKLQADYDDILEGSSNTLEDFIIDKRSNTLEIA